MREVEFVGGFEQDAMFMFQSSGGGKRGPGGVARREIDIRCVLRLGLEPARDVIGEHALGERTAKAFFQFPRDCLAVDRGSLLGGHAADRAALYELALDGVQGGQLVMARLKLRQFAGNSELIAQEVLKTGRQLNDELRARFVLPGGWIAAGKDQAMMKFRVGLIEALKKQLVKLLQALTRIEIDYWNTAQQNRLRHVRVLGPE